VRLAGDADGLVDDSGENSGDRGRDGLDGDTTTSRLRRPRVVGGARRGPGVRTVKVGHAGEGSLDGGDGLSTGPGEVGLRLNGSNGMGASRAVGDGRTARGNGLDLGLVDGRLLSTPMGHGNTSEESGNDSGTHFDGLLRDFPKGVVIETEGGGIGVLDKRKLFS